MHFFVKRDHENHDYLGGKGFSTYLSVSLGGGRRRTSWRSWCSLRLLLLRCVVSFVVSLRVGVPGAPSLSVAGRLAVRCQVVVVQVVQFVRHCRSPAPLRVASSRARARRAAAPCGAAPALARGRRRPQAPAVRQRVHQRPRVRAAAAQLARRRSPSRRCLLSGVSSPVLLENRGCQSR